MIKVLTVTVEEMENAGCSNGNYPRVSITLTNGKVIHGCTCHCGHGCGNTWRLPDAGARFDSMDMLYRFLRNEPPTGCVDVIKYARLIKEWCSIGKHTCADCPFGVDNDCALSAAYPVGWKLKEE